MSQHLAKIPFAALVALDSKAYVRVVSYMEGLGANALTFGWDWPTANVLVPSLVRRYRRVRGELVRRFKASGLTTDQYLDAHLCRWNGTQYVCSSTW